MKTNNKPENANFMRQEFWVKVYQSSNNKGRSAAVRFLAKRPEGVAFLISQLETCSLPEQCYEIVSALREGLYLVSGVNNLVSLLNSCNMQSRLSAANLLCYSLKPPDLWILSVLCECMKDECAVIDVVASAILRWCREVGCISDYCQVNHTTTDGSEQIPLFPFANLRQFGFAAISKSISQENKRNRLLNILGLAFAPDYLHALPMLPFDSDPGVRLCCCLAMKEIRKPVPLLTFVRLIDDYDAVIRKRALALTVSESAESPKVIRRVLKIAGDDRDADVRVAALCFLEANYPFLPEFGKLVVDYMNSDNHMLRAEARMAGSLKNFLLVKDALYNGLKDKCTSVRRCSLMSLKEYVAAINQDKAFWPWILTLKQNTQVEVREAILELLADLIDENEEWTNEMIAFLFDKVPRLRHLCIKSLSRGKGFITVRSVEVFKKRLTDDPDPEIRVLLANLLGDLGFKAQGAWPELKQAFTCDIDPEVRFFAAVAALKIQPKAMEPIPALKNAMETASNSEIRRSAATLLKQVSSF